MHTLHTFLALLIVLANTQTPANSIRDGVYVGTTNTGAFVGLIVEGENMALFVTDGTPERVRVAQWITGDEAKKYVKLEEAGGGLRGTVSPDLPLTWTGFECWPAKVTAGIFQTQHRDGSMRAWIQLENGVFRGAAFDREGHPSSIRTRPSSEHRISTLREFVVPGGGA